jgi:hypothetical protein
MKQLPVDTPLNKLGGHAPGRIGIPSIPSVNCGKGTGTRRNIKKGRGNWQLVGKVDGLDGQTD